MEITIIFCISLAFLITRASITEKFRNFVSINKFFSNLFHCPACTGFWIGVSVNIFYNYEFINTFKYISDFNKNILIVLNCIFLGVIIFGFNLFLNEILNYYIGKNEYNQVKTNYYHLKIALLSKGLDDET